MKSNYANLLVFCVDIVHSFEYVLCFALCKLFVLHTFVYRMCFDSQLIYFIIIRTTIGTKIYKVAACQWLKQSMAFLFLIVIYFYINQRTLMRGCLLWALAKREKTKSIRLCYQFISKNKHSICFDCLPHTRSHRKQETQGRHTRIADADTNEYIDSDLYKCVF